MEPSGSPSFFLPRCEKLEARDQAGKARSVKVTF